MIIIRSLDGIPITLLYATFSEAFTGYLVSWTQNEFNRMLSRRGFNPSLSFGAFDDERLVSFTFNGIGMFNGRVTAYDTGTGTIPSHRGQGLAGKIFRESVTPLKEAGIGQYLLEVLQDNDAAVALYKKQGFEITRTLNVFRAKSADWKKQDLPTVSDLQIREINFTMQSSMEAMWDFRPSWQNTFDALLRQPGSFIIHGAFLQNELVGYGIIEPASGDIPQLAVRHAWRRHKIGSRVLHALLETNKAPTCKVVNTDAAYSPITSFFEWNAIPKVTSQFEMIRKL